MPTSANNIVSYAHPGAKSICQKLNVYHLFIYYLYFFQGGGSDRIVWQITVIVPLNSKLMNKELHVFYEVKKRIQTALLHTSRLSKINNYIPSSKLTVNLSLRERGHASVYSAYRRPICILPLFQLVWADRQRLHWNHRHIQSDGS